MYAVLEVTEDGAVKAAPGNVVAVVLTAGEDAASVTLYDNASAASGTKLVTLKAALESTVVFCPCGPIVATAGIYADVSGTTPAVYVVYS